MSVHDPRPGAVSERREGQAARAAAYKAQAESVVPEVKGASRKLKPAVPKIKPVRWRVITHDAWLELADFRAPNNAGV